MDDAYASPARSAEFTENTGGNFGPRFDPVFGPETQNKAREHAETKHTHLRHNRHTVLDTLGLLLVLDLNLERNYFPSRFTLHSLLLLLNIEGFITSVEDTILVCFFTYSFIYL